MQCLHCQNYLTSKDAESNTLCVCVPCYSKMRRTFKRFVELLEKRESFILLTSGYEKIDNAYFEVKAYL
jgi:hypothetical protein